MCERTPQATPRGCNTKQRICLLGVKRPLSPIFTNRGWQQPACTDNFIAKLDAVFVAVLSMYPHQDFSVPISYCPESAWCSEQQRAVGSHGGPVARRNERERKRVRLVNMGFAKLRQYIPVTGRPGKRLSKVETLRSAIDYIRQLRQMLRQPPEPSYYYPPPQRLPQDPSGYRCDFGCPCNDGVPEYTFEGSPEMITMSYVPDPYVM